MRSTELNIEQYDSDKAANDYMKHYDQVFEDLINKEVVLLELGILHGGSLKLWRDYFPYGRIIGIDLTLPNNFQPTDRINIFEGSQTDTEFLSYVANKTAPEGLDIIIDDASHIGEMTKISFWHLFEKHLKPGGIYVIEDWGTGYWDDWHDGKSVDYDDVFNRVDPVNFSYPNHSYGMVGFVKQLIDEQGAGDATRKEMTKTPKRQSKFYKMMITPGLVFIIKNI